MKTIEQIAASIQSLRNEANELVCGASALEDNLTNLQAELRNFEKNGPLTTTIKTNDAAAIKTWLKAARRAHNSFSTEPTPELDRLIDLLPDA